MQYINRSYRRTGTLWDSRYKSSLVQAETYLFCAQRYIELNPVRAAMVDDPAHYRWTSYRANALGRADPRITPHPLYLALAATDKDRQLAYRALFRSHLDQAAIDGIRLALNQNQPLGNERFLGRIEKATGVRREARPRGRPRLEEAAPSAALPGRGELSLNQSNLAPLALAPLALDATNLRFSSMHSANLSFAASDWKVAMNQFAILYADRFTKAVA